jgi:hypothetical protein
MSTRDGLIVVDGAGAWGTAELDEVAAVCAIKVVPSPSTQTAAIQRPLVRNFEYSIPISSATFVNKSNFIF